MYDIIIIGAGVSGCAAARELARYKANICVIEKEEDVCAGTSKANSAIVHAGYDAPPGSLMAKLNVLGNQMMETVSKELDFEFKRIGSLVVCMNEKDTYKLEELMERGKKNGVKDLRMIDAKEAHQIEPNLSEAVAAALYAPTAGIVCPFGMNIAYAENANINGVEFKFNTEVLNICKKENGYTIETNQGVFETKVIVNAAGVYADQMHNMVSEEKIHIIPRRGDYCLLDKTAGNHVSHTIFPLPDQFGKGVLITPTVHGNLLVGPTAIDIEDKESTATTKEGIDFLIAKSGQAVQNIPMRQVITSFAGLRAHEEGHEFIIRELDDAKGFVDVAGIESPGLSSAPAIGVYVKDIVLGILDLEEKCDFIAVRKGILNPNQLDKEDRKELIQRNPAYGNIVCRCEMITEGEVLDSIHRPLGAKSLDGVKRRTRAGMGRCQAGFCSPRTMEILTRELGMPMSDVTKSGGGSALVVGTVKEHL